MKKVKTEFGSYYLFHRILNSWNGEEVYKKEKIELNKQINTVLSLQSGLGQTSQGHPENWDHRKKMKEEVKLLGESIKNALGII